MKSQNKIKHNKPESESIWNASFEKVGPPSNPFQDT